MKIMVVSNMAESLVNFRGPLLREFRDAGYEVLTVAPEEDDPRIAVLEGMGMRYVAVPMSRVGIDPLRDLGFLSRLVALMRAERPSVVLAYTIKPVVYGMVAAWLARAGRRAALVNGLGYALGSASAKQRLVGAIATLLYRLTSACSTVVILQNPDDRREFVRRRLVPEAKTAVVAGSGIDLERFGSRPLPTDGPVFLMIARLIREKGVVEFVDTARTVKARYPEARFQLLGPYDRAPGAIQPEPMTDWVKHGVVEYLGTTNDVRPALARASVFVRPSHYREGVPRTLLEALATGAPGSPRTRQVVARRCDTASMVCSCRPATLKRLLKPCSTSPVTPNSSRRWAKRVVHWRPRRSTCSSSTARCERRLGSHESPHQRAGFGRNVLGKIHATLGHALVRFGSEGA